MKNKIFILFILLSFYSCRNYDSEKYIAIENEAISDIVLQICNDVKIFYSDTNYLKLFLISSLEAGYETPEPDIEYIEHLKDIIENNTDLPDSEIKFYEEMYKRYKEEQKLLAPFKKGKLKKRILDYKFEYPNIQVELIPDLDSLPKWCAEDYISIPNELGYLWISRIFFNRRFDKGCLMYFLYRGDGSYGNNIEIVKINGRWKVSKSFQNGIAYNFENNRKLLAKS